MAKWENAGYKPGSKEEAQKNRKEARDLFGLNTKLEKIKTGPHEGKYRVLVKPSTKSKKKLKKVASAIRQFKNRV